MAKIKRLPANYFKFVNPIFISLVGVGLYLLMMAWLDPKNISTTYFGRVGEFATWLGTENGHLMKQIVLTVLAIHITETLVAVFLCYKRHIGPWATIAWTIQTLLLGIFSLSKLIWPGKPPKKQEKSSKESSKKSKEVSKKSKDASKKTNQKQTSNASQKKQTVLANNVQQRKTTKQSNNMKDKSKAGKQSNNNQLKSKDSKSNVSLKSKKKSNSTRKEK